MLVVLFDWHVWLVSSICGTLWPTPVFVGSFYFVYHEVPPPFFVVHYIPTNTKYYPYQSKSRKIFFVSKTKAQPTMSVKFGNEKSLNVGGIKMIPVRTEDDKQLFVKTEKCFSFGVKKDKKFKTVSMSLVLDEATTKILKDIVSQCEGHLGRPLTKRLFYGKDDSTIYPRLKPSTKFYELEKEIDPMKYEEKHCDVKAVLEVGGILLNGDDASLQVKVYEALVKEHVREHVRLVDMRW